MQIKQHLSPNFSSTAFIPKAIMLHHTGGGTLAGNVAWLCNPKASASAHFVVGKDGTIFELVRLTQRAWHAGRGGSLKLSSGFTIPTDMGNAYCFGIEIVNAGDGRDPFPEAQLAAIDYLVKYLETEVGHHLPIIDHREYAPYRKSDMRANFPLANYKKYGHHKADTAPTHKFFGRYRVTAKLGLKLRRWPIKGPSVKTIPYKKTIIATARKKFSDGSYWYQTAYKGKTGWVSGRYLRKEA